MLVCTGSMLCVSAGHTASLVSKYRPSVPILTLVIPQLKTEGSMKWKLEGRATARQCQISRSLFPVLAAPSPSGELALPLFHCLGFTKPRNPQYQ